MPGPLRLRLATLLTAAVLSVPAVVAGSVGADARVFDPKTFTLGNGMQVVVIENHRLPMITQMVWYRVGAADEPAGVSGIAHMLEHMMFKGTPSVPAGEFSKIVARNGGRDNAFTSSDYTGYYQTISVDRMELVMKLESDRMANLVFDDSIFATEHAVVREERRTRTDNEPSALLGERMNLALWVTHPYRNPIIGWDHELKALARGQAVEFYQKWYAPNNAVLIVAGDVTVDTVRPLAEKYYGALPRRAVPERSRVRDLPTRADAVVEMRHEDVQQPSWSRSYIAPSYTVPGDNAKTPYALQVLAELLGGGTTSRLYQSLVVTGKLAASAGAGYSPQALDRGEFSVYATPRPGGDVDAVAAAMTAELGRLVAGGVTADEVERAKTRLRAHVVYARDSLSAGARVFGTALTTGQTVEDVEAWPDRIATVTAADVNDAVRTVFTAAAHVTGILLPAAETATAGATDAIAPAGPGEAVTGQGQP